MCPSGGSGDAAHGIIQKKHEATEFDAKRAARECSVCLCLMLAQTWQTVQALSLSVLLGLGCLHIALAFFLTLVRLDRARPAQHQTPKARRLCRQPSAS